MKLKAKLKTLEGLDDAIAGLYSKQEDGTFALGEIEGLTSRDKVTEFRDHNTELLKLNTALKEKFKDIDPENYEALVKAAQEAKDKKLIDDGEIEKLFNERTQRMKETHDTALTDATTKLAAANSKLESVLIDSEVQKVAVSKGARSTALVDIVQRARQIFRLDGDKVVAYKGDKVAIGADGTNPLTMDEYMVDLVTNASHLFDPSSGGGGGGSTKHGDGSVSMQRDAFNKLSSAEQNKFVTTDGGKVTE